MLSCAIALGSGNAEAGPNAARLVTGLEGATGSTIGPGGALYVTEGAAGRISRVDPQTGEITTFASGLPNSIVGIGGAIDVAFIGSTAYALVTLVGPDVGGSNVVGIYRVDGPDSFAVVADIGEFNLLNPPNTPFDVPTGVQYALYVWHTKMWIWKAAKMAGAACPTLKWQDRKTVGRAVPAIKLARLQHNSRSWCTAHIETYRGGFLVTDGHHNRVLWVTLDGEVTELIAFDNIVPTGLAVSGYLVYMAEAGPVPHESEDGEVASGASLLVDVEFGRGRRLYALSQGEGSGGPAGSPALPNTGALVEVNGDGTFTVITDGLDRPTSLEFIGNTAYVVTLTGEIWKIDGVSGPPYGMSH
jgi:hypothetical protein